ncbi:MAG: UbiD family decarboxylase [Nitrososphaeria archaeon]|nr:UbiD family decarboxylase [Nitrososphaeria archaeon]NIN53763.1 UbiD family decarboxylase [Nitrososphaeria archaeon]NIQ34323.1 UbiD family decarboxylase [Nitrososphaeria archaeon]
MRRFLRTIEPRKITKKVSTRLEAASYLRDGESILFEKVERYPNFRVAGNLLTSREVVAATLDTPKEKLLFKLSGALEAPEAYKITQSANFFKNVFQEPDVIKHIPLLMYYEREERYYTTATIIMARDPETGRQNASFHRMMYLERNRFAVRLVPRDLHDFYLRNRRGGRDTDIVVVCGVHPLLCLAAATSYPGLNELELANTLLGGRLTCIQLDGIDVPSDAEVVMTGRILHDQTAKEGPFVDLTRTWDAIREQPIIEIEKIYLRDEPIWQVILPGGIEHCLLMGLPQEPRMYKIIQNSVPSVRNVVLTEGGCYWLHAVVSIEKRVEGEGKNAGLAALAAHPSLKRVIVVDEDIDILDPESVEWALATRLQPSRGMVFIPETRGSSLDPSPGKTGVTTKWIIDATIPLDRNKSEFAKADVPRTNS